MIPAYRVKKRNSRMFCNGVTIRNRETHGGNSYSRYTETPSGNMTSINTILQYKNKHCSFIYSASTATIEQYDRCTVSVNITRAGSD